MQIAILPASWDEKIATQVKLSKKMKQHEVGSIQKYSLC